MGSTFFKALHIWKYLDSVMYLIISIKPIFSQSITLLFFWIGVDKISILICNWFFFSLEGFGITVLKFIIVLWAGFLSSCWALEMDCLSVKIHILWCCKFFLTIMLSPQQNLLSLNVSKWWSCACFSKHEIEHFKNLLEEQWIMVFYVDWQHKEKSHFLQKYISFSTPLSQWRYYL